MKPEGSDKTAAPPTRSKRPRRKRRRTRLLGCLGVLITLAIGAAAVWVLILDREITRTFEGRLWAIPSRVYSAPLALQTDASVTIARIQARLDRASYTRVSGSPSSPGQYRIAGGTIEIHQREFPFPGDPWRHRRVRLAIRDGRLEAIIQLPSGRSLDSVQLEPEPIASFYGTSREERTVLPLPAFPKSLVEAILAAEDQRFLSHHGIDPLGILRALWEDLRRGGVVQGGSTITQQTVKNIYLTNERSVTRKIKEGVMALLLDIHYTKEKILSVYMNEIYLGQRGSAAVCGFGEASRFYFGKDARDLDLAESATLAGMIRAPAVYSPITHPDRALARKNLVVKQMLEQGRITPQEAQKATVRKPPVSKGLAGFRRAPYFVDEIRSELSRVHSDKDLTDRGLRVITTLDTWLQEKAEDALRQGLERIEKERPKLLGRHPGGLEGCLVALRPKTGEVVALVGGRDYQDSQFDRVTQARRQPGSLFKPFVYATGFEHGRSDTNEPFTPATILEDTPITLVSGGKEWTPHNYDELFRGPVSARQALEESLNVPTVRAAVAIGLDRIVEIAKAAGLGEEIKPYPSTALGAQEVVPIDAAAAFAVFPNGGRRPSPFTVTAVVDEKGQLIEETKPQLVEVLSLQAAYLTLDLMRGVIDRGTARAIREHGLTGDLAGKTGTTNDKRDSWFVGFAPDLLALVWVGFDDGAETTLTGAAGAAPIWEAFMHSSGEASSWRRFPEPEGILRQTIDPTTGELATGRCPTTAEEIFIDGAVPDECQAHPAGAIKRFWRRLFGKDKG